MKTTIVLLTLVAFIRGGCYGAPASSTDAVFLGEIDIMTNEDVEISTEEPIPKKCNFGGTTYTHSQTIPTSDPCSRCLCVAGEVYCWWQDCLLHSSEPEDFDNFESNLKSTETPGLLLNGNSSSFGIIADADNGTLATDVDSDNVQLIEEDGYMDVNSTYQQDLNAISTPPTTCLVMGIEYKEGEALPHSTGNCVQCGCGSAGRVECSPQDCVPLLQPPSGAGVDLSRGMDEIF